MVAGRMDGEDISASDPDRRAVPGLRIPPVGHRAEGPGRVGVAVGPGGAAGDGPHRVADDRQWRTRQSTDRVLVIGSGHACDHSRGEQLARFGQRGQALAERNGAGLAQRRHRPGDEQRGDHAELD
jgi:hypothetical protein